MGKPSVGILGLGFLGRELCDLFSWSDGSWGSVRHTDVTGGAFLPKIQLILFDWSDVRTWDRIPHNPVTIVLTIPPVRADRLRERDRVRRWCDWMADHRHVSERLVYISSTGVYPHQTGRWDERSEFEPDSPKGSLRWDTERILGEYFQLRIIRPGAIYGRGRDIGQRLLDSEPIPRGEQPVHRIHLRDLARVVRLAIVEEEFPSILNAVDKAPESSERVAQWLVRQDFFPFPAGRQIVTREGYVSRKYSSQIKGRFICNRRLVEEREFNFIFPTYKEGLKGCYDR
jgi:NAD dependent epimerase/dehydratase family enzyme